MSAMALHPAAAHPAALHPAQRATTRQGASRSLTPRTGARTARQQSRLHLTPRGRAVFVALALLLVAGLVMVGSRAAASGPESAVQVERHVVMPGETLWEIASGITPQGHDVRDTVAQLKRLNGLPDGGLTAGQVIVVPAG